MNFGMPRKLVRWSNSLRILKMAAFRRLANRATPAKDVVISR
jgi:hypothetical protein